MRRGAGVVDRGGLETRCALCGAPWVRIPPPPPAFELRLAYASKTAEARLERSCPPKPGRRRAREPHHVLCLSHPKRGISQTAICRVHHGLEKAHSRARRKRLRSYVKIQTVDVDQLSCFR